MSAAPLIGIKACVFDAYGTLFDYGSAATRCKDQLGENLEPLIRLWRDKQLQYTWLRAAQGRHADFWQVTGDALDFAFETLGIADGALRQRLMDLYLTLDPFPEVEAVLRKLKQAGMMTAILSNGTPSMLKAAVSASGIEDLLDEVLSVAPESLSARCREARHAIRGDRAFLVQCLGRPCRLRVWDAHGLVQSLWPEG